MDFSQFNFNDFIAFVQNLVTAEGVDGLYGIASIVAGFAVCLVICIFFSIVGACKRRKKAREAKKK